MGSVLGFIFEVKQVNCGVGRVLCEEEALEEGFCKVEIGFDRVVGAVLFLVDPAEGC